MSLPRLLLSALLCIVGLSSASTAQDVAVGESAQQPLTDEQRETLKQRYLDELKAALQDLEENGESLEKLERVADMYLRLGEPQRAALLFERAINEFGGSEGLFIKFARVLLLSGRPELGLKVVNIGLEAFPESAPLHFELGKAHNSFGKRYAAISSFNRAIAIDPEEDSYRYFLADTYRAQQKLERASEIIDQLIEEDSEYLPVYLMKGDLMLAQGDRRQAVRYLQDLREEHPDSPELRQLLVHAHQLYAFSEATSGRLSRAIKTLEEALEIEPDNPETRAAIGTFHYEAGEHAKAEGIFQEVLEHHPNYLETYSLYGALLLFLDRKEDAAAVYRRGLEKARELEDEASAAEFAKLLAPASSS